MGYDIYMKWKGQTKEERKAQFTGFSTVHGHVGYLREAFHGEPYATRALMPEAFSEEDVAIRAAVLRDRLPSVLRVVEEREKKVYRSSNPMHIARVQKSFSDFVELAERKEAETGEPVTIHVS